MVSVLEVIATNGEVQKRIIWIAIRENGIYCDVAFKGLDRHFSLHKSGWFYTTYEGKTEKHYQLEPLDKFKRKHQLASFTFSQDITKLTTPDYKMKKLNSVILVDVRAYTSKPFVVCNIDVVEPKRFDLLEGIEKFANEIHIYTQYIPWIVISVY
jgi:hypothetical protein